MSYVKFNLGRNMIHLKCLKTQFKAVSAGALILIVAACKTEVSTVLQLNQTVSLYSDKRIGNDRVPVKIPAGQHSAIAKLESNKIRLVVSDVGSTGFTFNIPRGMKLPATNGSIELKPIDSAQPYLLRLQVSTEYEDTSPTRTTESCTLPRVKEVCDTVYDPTEKKDRYVCNNQTVYESGTVEVEYHYRIETTDYLGELLTSNSQPIGNIKGSKSKSDTVYDYRGECYVSDFDNGSGHHHGNGGWHGGGGGPGRGPGR